MIPSRVFQVSLALVVGVVSGCGEEKSSEPEPSIEKALSHVVEGQDKMKAHADPEAMKKMREKAAAEAEKARQETFDALIVVPENSPASPGELCAAASKAYDAYMQSRLIDTALERWNAVKEPDLEKMESTCKAEKNPQVWGCKLGALQGAPADFTDKDGEKLLMACEDKFGSKKADQ